MAAARLGEPASRESRIRQPRNRRSHRAKRISLIDGIAALVINQSARHQHHQAASAEPALSQRRNNPRAPALVSRLTATRLVT